MINNEIQQNLDNARKAGKTIGLVQGSWDLFHVGHLKYIKKAMRRCDFLVIGLDGDEKIRKRKGPSRPIIPEVERYELLKELGLADVIVIKGPNEPKWGLIKAVRPDVLIAIQENYKPEDISQLEQFCGRIEILPRQSEKSTSDAVRRIMIADKSEQFKLMDERITNIVEKKKQKIGFSEDMGEPLPQLLEYLKESTDSVCPVAVGCFWQGRWHFGANQIDLRLPQHDIDNRTELFYATVDHAETNLLKKLGNIDILDVPIWTTLFPCDRCMKVLKDKGVKEIYYLEDHPERNWSKRSHEMADKHGIKTISIIKELNNTKNTKKEDEVTNAMVEMTYQFIDPRNAREGEQLNIMMQLEAEDKDPLDPGIIQQEILFKTDYWYVSENRFPYDEVEHHFLIASSNPVYKIEDMSKEMWLDLKNVWDKLILQYNIPGGALCYRFGDTLYSGASLTRLHAHLIMPKRGYKTKASIGSNNEKERGKTLNLVR